MSEKFLNYSQVCSVFYHLCCETVSEHMRSNVFWELYFFCNIIYCVPNAFILESVSGFVYKNRCFVVDFCRIIDLDDDFFDDSLDADTLAGLMLELKGDFPKIHEKFTYNDLSFEILKKEQRRISRVKVVINNAKKK